MAETFHGKTGRRYSFVAPLESIYLEARDDEDRPLGGWFYLASCDGDERTGQLDDKGCATVEKLRPGVWKVKITEDPPTAPSSGAAPAAPAISAAEIEPVDDEPARLRRASLGAVLASWSFDPTPVPFWLRVVDEDLNPFAAAHVSLADGHHQATTDADGFAHFPAIIPARYGVEVKHGELVTHAHVRVERGGETNETGASPDGVATGGRTIPIKGKAPPAAELVIRATRHYTLAGSTTMRWAGGDVDFNAKLLDASGSFLAWGTVASNKSVVLKLTGRTDGKYILHLTADHVAQEPAPHVDVPDANPPDAMYRIMVVDIELKGEKLQSANIKSGIHGNLIKRDPLELVVDWKPDWLASPGFGPRPAATKPSIIVLHRTSESGIGGTLTKFRKPGPSAHFVVDVDGHVTTMVAMNKASNHVGAAFWNGPGVRGRSIGIEITNNLHQPYPEAQKRAVIKLVKELCADFSIDAENVVGHGDVNVWDDRRPAEPLMLDYERHYDPGLEFFWGDLAQSGLALDPWSQKLDPADEAGMYAELFTRDPALVLQHGSTSDASLDKASKIKPGGSPISELQKDLRAIGYSIHGNGSTVTGTFNEATYMALLHFQNHFFAGAWSLSVETARAGKFDRETALMIKRCLEAM